MSEEIQSKVDQIIKIGEQGGSISDQLAVLFPPKTKEK